MKPIIPDDIVYDTKPRHELEGKTVYVVLWHYDQTSDDVDLAWNTVFGVFPTKQSAEEAVADERKLKPKRVYEIEEYGIAAG